jgi:hypothetical protein
MRENLYATIVEIHSGQKAGDAIAGFMTGVRAKKAPRKAHVPGGQRTLRLFRERLDAITLACGRTLGRSRRGEERIAARRGVYRSGWPASVPMPTAAGSVRSSSPLSRVTHPRGLVISCGWYQRASVDMLEPARSCSGLAVARWSVLQFWKNPRRLASFVGRLGVCAAWTIRRGPRE